MTRKLIISLLVLTLAAYYMIWGVLSDEPFRFGVGIILIVLSAAIIIPKIKFIKMPQMQ